MRECLLGAWPPARPEFARPRLRDPDLSAFRHMVIGSGQEEFDYGSEDPLIPTRKSAAR
jgi:hypothetical protein